MEGYFSSFNLYGHRYGILYVILRISNVLCQWQFNGPFLSKGVPFLIYEEFRCSLAVTAPYNGATRSVVVGEVCKNE